MFDKTANNERLHSSGGGAEQQQQASGQQQVRRTRETVQRFFLLASAACFMFGNYYFFDQTSATQGAILDHTGMSSDMFGMLSSVYSWPNVILPLFGGLFIDVFGLRMAVVGFTTLVLAGSGLFTLGLWCNNTSLLVAARVVFGIGGESQNVASLTLISRWFAGRELAFAFAINVAVSRLGSVAAFDSQPALVSGLGVTGASATGSCFCMFSLLAAIVAVTMDSNADKRDAARGFLSQGHRDDVDEAVSIKDIAKFGKLYWLLTISCVSVYVACFPFMQVLSAPFLSERFGFNEGTGDSIASVINLVSAFLSPVLGLFVDKFGRRPLLLVSSSACFCLCHSLFLAMPPCHQCLHILALYILLGVALSVYGSVVWPSVSMVVDADTTGTALGLTTAMQNFGMAVSPMIITHLRTVSNGFQWPFAYIVGCCVVGLVAGVAVWTIDSKGDRRLVSGGNASG